MGKRLPSGQYSNEIEVCKEMGWSWEQLQAAPAPMVDEILVKLDARAQAEREQFRAGSKRRRG